MKWFIYLIWAFSSDNYIERNMLSAKISESIFGVPASIQFAQAIYESGYGQSYIAQNSNNHFGIRYYPETFTGSHFVDRAGSKWRAYAFVFFSYLDHAHFIWSNYNQSCFKEYGHFKHLKGYGEAQYWIRIVKLVESQKLHKYDSIHWGRPSI
jgi:flagellum-specific peptidoglycan hydrolase FlgJ